MLSIRTGYVLPDTAWVVRGSDLRKRDIRRTATLCLKQHDVLGISVFAADVPEAADVVQEDRHLNDLRNRFSQIKNPLVVADK